MQSAATLMLTAMAMSDEGLDCSGLGKDTHVFSEAELTDILGIMGGLLWVGCYGLAAVNKVQKCSICRLCM